MSDSFTKIKEIEAFLDSVPKFSKSGQSAANFNLDRMKKFCDRMGNPEKKFQSIHVGGTNGKGTVCRMAASVYQEAGYDVGLYISPHLIDVKERFLINTSPISDALLIEFFENYGAYIRNEEPTYFEITTAIAFWFFANKNVDIAILEVGLGGRLDATNVVNPLLSVITSIGLDHQDILGYSLKEIAFEKAGIIKKAIPILMGELPAKAKAVIQSQAHFRNSRVIGVEDLDPKYEQENIRFSGFNQLITIDAKKWKKIDAQNVAIVYKIIDTLSSRYTVQKDEFVNGIERVHERFKQSAIFEKIATDRLWYFDGAHNAQSVKMLTEHLLTLAPAKNWIVVLSFMKDKLNEEIAKLWNKFPYIYLYEMESERAATEKLMKQYLPEGKIVNNFDFLQSDDFKTELVIFSGSFYFYSIISTWVSAIASADQKNPSAL